MKNFLLFILAFATLVCFTSDLTAQVTTAPLGTGTSASSGRGPFQRSDVNSASVFSRAHLVYTAAEIASLGIVSGDIISQVNWDLGSTNIITATGDATMDVYMKNSSIAGTAIAQWSDIIAGATQVGTYTFNTANNFPGVEGFLAFPTSDFIYTGGSLEIAVDWDCSGLVPLDPGSPNQLFSGNGSLNWHYSNTAHNSSADRSGTSGPPSELQGPMGSRVNTQFVYTPGDGSVPPVDLCVGTGTSSSSGRGPFQRSDVNSGSVFSRAHLVYLASEYPDLVAGSIISQISWDLGSTNVITATGNATMDVYMKNSTIMETSGGQWSDIITGAILVGTYTFNTTNNFPGTEGFMQFDLDSDFVYTGGTLEVAVDWDCSGLVPLDPGAPNQLFSGNGSLNWHYSNTAHNSSSDRSGTSGSPSELISPLTSRVNTCFLAAIPTILPVTLTSFEGRMEAGGSRLNWETTSELNNKGFEIEHSRNGRDFSSLEFVLGNGTTQVVNHYSFLHKNPAEGANYYRLKQVDFDGAFEYSEILHLVNKSNDTPGVIYPNPASDIISYEGVPATLKIYDIYGRQVVQQTAEVENTTIDISQLEVGAYLVEILSTTNEKTFKRFIKSK